MKIEEEIEQRKFRNEWQKAAINILFSGSWLQLQVKNVLKPYGITSQQYNVLKILKGQSPKPVSTNLVRDRMLDKMSDVSRIVARLQEKELVSVCRASHDKRLVDIIINEKGIRLLDELDALAVQLDNILSKLTETEATELNRLLDKMRE